jgi:transposase
VRTDPLTGQVRCIKVSGNFRFAYNMIAIISPNPDKPSPVHYILGEDNGNAACFTAYIMQLIAMGWFAHGDVLILDNASIHTGRESAIVKDLLWETIVDGRPLNCLSVSLPTRSPELNSIELIFHVLSHRLHSYRYHVANPTQMTMPIQAARVMGDMSHELTLKCCGHCGY